MNKYIKPSINIVELATETALLSFSTDGLEGATYGGENTGGSHTVGAKPYTSESLWEDDED